MPGGLADKAEEVIRTHPAVFVFVVLVSAAILTYSASVFASKAEIESMAGEISTIQREVRELRSHVDARFLQTEIRSVEREIYQIESLQATGEALERDVDRMLRLRSDLRELLLELDALSRRR